MVAACGHRQNFAKDAWLVVPDRVERATQPRRIQSAYIDTI